MQKLNDFALRAFVQAFAADRKGVTAVEYGIIAGLIATALVAAIGTFSTDLSTAFTTIGGKV